MGPELAQQRAESPVSEFAGKKGFKVSWERVCMCVEGILLTAFNSLRSYYNRPGRRALYAKERK